MDVQLAVLLLILVAADGLKRVEAGTRIFRQLGSSAWSAGAPEERSRWTIPAPLTPWCMSVLVHPAAGAATIESAELIVSFKSSQYLIVALRVLGVVQMTAVVVGIPVSVSRWSGLGLLSALSAVFLLNVVIAMLALHGWRRVSTSRRPRFRHMLSWFSPFSAATAAQDMLQETFARATASQVAGLVLAEPAYREWLRPIAFDIAHGVREAREYPLTAPLDLGEVLETPPPADAEATEFCPRCGQTWLRPVEFCEECQVWTKSFE